jgi:ABC-type transport system involved in cytochrome c biogenesis ATPase subunit
MSLDIMHTPMAAVAFDSRFDCLQSGRQNYQQVTKLWITYTPLWITAVLCG